MAARLHSGGREWHSTGSCGGADRRPTGRRLRPARVRDVRPDPERPGEHQHPRRSRVAGTHPRPPARPRSRPTGCAPRRGRRRSPTSPTGADRVWVVDPIDGTRGFARKNGEFSVMIGLTVDGRPVVGVVLEPVLRPRAPTPPPGAGAGSTVGDGEPVRCRVTDATDSAEATLVQSRSKPGSRRSRSVAALRPATVIETYSAGVKLAIVARGEADVYVNDYAGFHDWDMCAGHVLVEEAGGRVTLFDGEPVDLRRRRVASSGAGMIATQRPRPRRGGEAAGRSVGWAESSRPTSAWASKTRPTYFGRTSRQTTFCVVPQVEPAVHQHRQRPAVRPAQHVVHLAAEPELVRVGLDQEQRRPTPSARSGACPPGSAHPLFAPPLRRRGVPVLVHLAPCAGPRTARRRSSNPYRNPSR